MPETDPVSPPRRRFLRRRDPARRSLLWRLRRVGYGLLVVAVIAVGGAWMAFNTVELPPEKRQIETSFICDDTVVDGQCGFDSAMARLSSSEERILVKYEDLPRVLVEAVLSSEDRNFFDHNGVDPVGVFRALYRDLSGTSESQQGGSTITQQYVKQTYLSAERTPVRKLREAALAVKLERELDKREILIRYLNEVYFGRGAYGVEAASRAYFGVGVGSLQLYQAAYLAGLLRAPESADATRRPEEATRRRNGVLAAMNDEGYITDTEERAASKVPWNSTPNAADGSIQAVTIQPRAPEKTDFGPVRHSDIGSEYWVALVRQQLRARFGAGAETRGLRVYTTFDPTLQREAYTTVTQKLNQPDGPVGSLVSIDDKGQIKAMVGGESFAESQVNLALGKDGGGGGRPPGSTFKPFAPASFIEDGYSTQSRFKAPPTTQFPNVLGDIPGQLWSPGNYDKADHGVMTVEQATWGSVNTVYAGIVNEVTPQSLADMATRLGVRTPLKPVYSLVLGSMEVSVLDMASAYSTFADRGNHIEPHVIRRIEDSEGNVLFDASTDVKPTQVLQPNVADTVNYVLSGVVDNGTGRAAHLAVPAAGKTGTTDENKDAWFTGYTCHLTTSVWMGYRTPKEMTTYKGQKVQGGTIPAEMWHDYMAEATKDDAPCEFPKTDAGTKILNKAMAPSRSAGGTGSSSTTSTVPQRSTTTSPGPSTTSPAPATTATPTTTAPTTTAAPPTTVAQPVGSP